MKNRKILTILFFLCIASIREEVYIDGVIGEKGGSFWEIDEDVYARLLGDGGFLRLSDDFLKARLAYDAELTCQKALPFESKVYKVDKVHKVY